MEPTYGPIAGLPKMVHIHCAPEGIPDSKCGTYEPYEMHCDTLTGLPVGVEFAYVAEAGIGPWEAVDAAACKLRQIITEQSEGMDSPAVLWRRVPQVQKRDDPQTGGAVWTAGARIAVIDLAKLPREAK